MFTYLSSHKQSTNTRRINDTLITRYRKTQKDILYNRTWWYKNGELHRVDGPARIIYFENGQIDEEEWIKDGKSHRINDAPAYIKYFESGKIQQKSWYVDGKRHRNNDAPGYKDGKHYYHVDSPPIIKYFKNAFYGVMMWLRYGDFRIDAPAVINYFENGQIEKEEWWQNGKHYRIDAPGIVEYSENGTILNNVWYTKNGRLHSCEIGPIEKYI